MKFPEEFRWKDPGPPFQTKEGEPFGVFLIPSRVSGGRELSVIACDATDPLSGGWEHVSVSVSGRRDRCATWNEMCAVKNLFWEPDKCVVQFHPPEADYVNDHPGVLHLWHKVGEPFPMPPKHCV